MTDKTTTDPGLPRPLVVPAEAPTLTAEAVGELRALVAQDRAVANVRQDEAADAAATVRTRAEQIERARVLGDVVWTAAGDRRLITMTNARTGGCWVRNELGDWRQDPPLPPVAQQIAALLRQGVDQVDAVAALLRRDLRPWRELLDEGARAAWEAGGGAQVVRLAQREVAGLLVETARAAHRIVLVVEDADAYAASWYADASAAADAAWVYYCRRQANMAQEAGAGRVPAGTYRDRQEAVLHLVTFRGGQRPGAVWCVEPVLDGAR